MNRKILFEKLSSNRTVIVDLLTGITPEEYLWRPNPNHWCLLEIGCHLCDIEREDFRARIQHLLENPELPFKAFDPLIWIKERDYLKQDYQGIVENFSEERSRSIDWLGSLSSPNWNNARKYGKFGSMSAIIFLYNWVAHDYLHIRQITRVKYNYLKHNAPKDLDYAGKW